VSDGRRPDPASAADTDIAGQSVLLLSARRDCSVHASSSCSQIVDKLTTRGRRAAECAAQDLAYVVAYHSTVLILNLVATGRKPATIPAPESLSSITP